MNADLTLTVSETPDYDPSGYRGYAPIMRETFAPLTGEVFEAVDVPAKTREDLQWGMLLERLAEHCFGDEARTVAESLPALEHRESIERRLREVEEAARLIIMDVAPPLQGLSSIGACIDHARRGGMLEPDQLLTVARVARVAGAVKRFFGSRRHLAPLLAQPAEDLQPTPELIKTMEHAFDPSGKLADHASPDLGGLRRRVQNYHDRLKRRIDNYLKATDFQNFLQDGYFTIRNDRYVLPIRSGEKGNVPGIVHGTSGSGQTIFIEPTDLVEMNNDLQLAQMEVEEEERRILLRLTGLVAEESSKLASNLALLTYIDLTIAKARLAIELVAHRPELSERGALDLRQARHPGLVLKVLRAEDPFEIVANDIALGLPAVHDGEVIEGVRSRVLIVSGPNTGGKTVTLKTIGMCCLMTRCGLHIPALPNSEVPLMDAIFTDIGDEQSIERDLSTFSGHVKNINSFIERVTEGSLVLLDELFAGTDPEQGAALATALLEHAAECGAMVAVTTHLESLKTLAFQTERFSNASVGFDIQKLAPTYRLTMDMPGSSYAIRIARRLGLPEAIVQRAEKVATTTGAADIEKILRQLEHQRDRMEREADQARRQRREAQKMERKYERKLAEIGKRELGLVHKETRALMEEISAAQELVRNRTRALQGKDAPEILDHKVLETIRAELVETSKTISKKSKTRERDTQREQRQPARAEDLEIGHCVWVGTFKRPGEILELDRGRNRAMVQVGGIKATVALDELFCVRPEERPPKRNEQPAPLPVEPRSDTRVLVLPPQNDSNTVNLRGMRVDEGLERLEFFLDAAYRTREPGIYIIHGHGTGALRTAVRAFLPTSRVVSVFRPGERGEGGNGVTVAFMT